MSKNESQKVPAYQAAVLFVLDINKSKHFYSEILGQKIVADFGRNIGFEGGLSIWEKNYAFNTIFKEKAKEINSGCNNIEIYFEYSNLNELLNKLTQNNVKVIHPITEHPWGQRAFRIYDPDSHIIEFAESMSSVVLRLHNEGLSYEEIAKKSMMTIDFIKETLQKK